VADALGVRIETTRFLQETHPTPRALDTALGPIGARTIGAYYWRLQGIVGGEPRIAVEYVARVTREAPVPEHWPRPAPDTRNGAIVYRIEGRPSFRTQVYADLQPGESVHASLAMTARHAINAIPSVISAAPGLITALDLKPYTTRSARFGNAARGSSSELPGR
jgi:4-hydroxy-tetrahydrodipicolinate reductase